MDFYFHYNLLKEFSLSLSAFLKIEIVLKYQHALKKISFKI